MSFDLNILANGASKAIQLMDQATGTTIEIHCKGGLMNSWTVQYEGQALQLIMGNNGAADFEKNGFRSGKMSPFSCRIDGGKYQKDDQTFKFEKFYLGEHALHGLMYDAEFSILSTEVHQDYINILNAYGKEIYPVFMELGYNPDYSYLESKGYLITHQVGHNGWNSLAQLKF